MHADVVAASVIGPLDDYASRRPPSACGGSSSAPVTVDASRIVLA